jgi:predicted flap endonuclease-1-like 5' DNA nuclease
MEVFDRILAAAQQVYPFTRLSLSLTVFFSVIILGIAIGGIRGYLARRREREEADGRYEYREPVIAPEDSPRVVLDELIAEQAIAAAPVEAAPSEILAAEPAPEEAPAAVLPADEPAVEPEPVEMPAAASEVPAPAPIIEPETAAIVAEAPVVPPAPAAVEGPDDLTVMRGVGPRLAEKLNALGITRFVQLAMLDSQEAEALDAQLGAYKGQLERDRWIDQAQMLALGDMAGFEKHFASA